MNYELNASVTHVTHEDHDSAFEVAKALLLTLGAILITSVVTYLTFVGIVAALFSLLS